VAALGGPERIAQSSRLPIRKLENVCERLRVQYGLTSPLTQARLIWDGTDIVVQLLGARFEPETGQLLLTLSDQVRKHLTYMATPRAQRLALYPLMETEKRKVLHDGAPRTRAVLQPRGVAILSRLKP